MEAEKNAEIMNADGMRVENPDLTKGYITQERREIRHEAIPAQEAVWHWEKAREHGNGGISMRRVIDRPAVQAVPERVSYETVWIYRTYTEEERTAMHAQTTQERLSSLEKEMSTLREQMQQVLARFGVRENVM